jgi:5-methylcytosine-specific restriction endonuclease McrA
VRGPVKPPHNIVEANITWVSRVRKEIFMSVFVVDTNKVPLAPCHEAKARILLDAGKAAIFRVRPFTIILKRAVFNPQVPDLRIKLDLGSRTTGIAVVDDESGKVVYAAELEHRGETIKKSLDDRRSSRRRRRTAHLRYRAARWQNRRRKEGWLPPSLQSRIANTLTWVARLSRLCRITAISLERVKFDMQLLENPEISGIEYQQGILQGYDVREYLLLKWEHKCTYCKRENVPLQIEHIVPRAKRVDNRVCNLCLACEPCNKKKGTKAISDFLKKKPELLKQILAQAKAPLRDAAAVNTTRKELYQRLQGFGLPIECGSGGLTKYNRTNRKLPKTHWLDAACVGKSTPEVLDIRGVQPLRVRAYGRGCRQMCLSDKYGFPRTSAKKKGTHGFQTGDIVKAVVPAHLKNAGIHISRMSAKASGAFTIATSSGTVTDIGNRYCRKLQQADGYRQERKESAAFPPAP